MKDLNSLDIENELKGYIESEDFKNDCASVKAFYTAFDDEPPSDSEIREQAICEKRIYFENIKKCLDEGHDWDECDSEYGQTKKEYYCKRCGKMQ